MRIRLKPDPTYWSDEALGGGMQYVESGFSRILKRAHRRATETAG
jgi:hypothetical protein